MSSQDKIPSLRSTSWAIVASYAAAVIMTACFAIAAAGVAQRVFPKWDGNGVAIMGTLVAVEAFLSCWLLKHTPAAQREPIQYRLYEWAILLVILKLFTELRGGLQDLIDNILLWPQHFPAHVLTGNYLLNVLLAFLVWALSKSFTTDIYLLEVEEAVRVDKRVQNSSVQELILHRVIRTGIVMIILAGALFADTWLPGSSAGGKAISPFLLYFLSGLILASISRYANLEGLWTREKVRVPQQLPRRWVLYTILVLSIAAVLAWWLTTNSAVGLQPLVKALYQVIASAIKAIYAFLASVFGKTPQVDLSPAATEVVTTEQPAVTAAPEAILQGPQAAINLPYLEIIKSVLIWGGVATLLFLIVRQYIHFNQDFLDDLKKFRPLRWLAIFWQRMKESFSKANQSMGTLIQSRIGRMRKKSVETTGNGSVNVRKLTPRQKVIFYYLAMIRRAEQAGIPRLQEQTPYEYKNSFEVLPAEEKNSVENITEAFVEARYSNHDITPENARHTESIWGLLRNALRRRKHAISENPTSEN